MPSPLDFKTRSTDLKLYRTTQGFLVEADGKAYNIDADSWDELLNSTDLMVRAEAATKGTAVTLDASTILAPVTSQEVWASGVTYYRSRDARMEESKAAGGGDFYDRVYVAERPELFFKSAGWRAVGPGDDVRIRTDATWSIPEPELVLVANARGEQIGLTIGNDMSSRDIEGENPLYLPQAKVYNGSCALGPCILLTAGAPLDRSMKITLEIVRGSHDVVTGSTTLAELKREPAELLEYLFRELSFPSGALLFTGTGVVPPNEFTLHPGDVVRISIDGIGTLENTVSA
jgi:2-dehydro-3-deoxy-D-arabinonate dehydratase